MTRLVFQSICLIIHACVIGQYVEISDTCTGSSGIPFNPVYLPPEIITGCDGYHTFQSDIDKDSLIDVKVISECVGGGPYLWGSLTIETFNNFYVHVDTNFQTLITWEDTNGLNSELRKVPVPKKYSLNDTIYQNAYAWDSTETIIGKYSWSMLGYTYTHIDLDYFEGDTTYIALTKTDGNYNSIYYFKIYVHNFSVMTLFSLKTTDSVLINTHNCLTDGMVFTEQSQIDNFYYNFPFCNTIEGDVEVSGDEIKNLNGLADLTAIMGDLKIINTDSLPELSGLDNLNELGGSLQIKDNLMLNNLSALSNIDSIGGDLHVENNDSLLSLLGLENIAPATIEDLTICKNDSLTFCDFENICQYLSNPNGAVSIYENAPGCYNEEELAMVCDTTDISENVYMNSITIHPNPADEVIRVSHSPKITINELDIYNLSGQLVLHENLVNNLLDITSLKPGMYIIELKFKYQIVRRKLIIK
ncbi:MAG: T9SS type A sorting domain-containing protein [Bacteroidales bacterium]